MLRYFKKKPDAPIPVEENVATPSASLNTPIRNPSVPPNIDVDIDNLPADPGLRIPIMDYDPNVREQVRRLYLQKGPCQPRNHSFPFQNKEKDRRRFNPDWFSKYSSWLEYSKERDAAFCLCCYLFRPHTGKQGGGDSFVGEGFKNWTKAIYKFNKHLGDAHNEAWNMCENLLNQHQHISTIINKHSSSDQKWEAGVYLNLIHSFGFVFSLHLMKSVMGITNDLSQTLQRKDQDIVNAMKLVSVCKERLQIMRETGWDSFFNQVSSFCLKHHIEVSNMDDIHSTQGRPRRNVEAKTNMHHYRVDLFYNVIDMQMLELNHRFNETNTELLICVACLSPSDLFSAFNKDRLIQLANFYPRDFSPVELVVLVNIEKDIFNGIDNEVIIHRFQNMKRRRMVLNQN